MMTLLTVNRAQDQELSSIVLLVRMFMKEFLRIRNVEMWSAGRIFNEYIGMLSPLIPQFS
ncbi:hypothetical protein KY284_008163 [Solanum tuberosum]|nr:hypothetical protein KY284_008163 [Solanum tuberosum]